ncbi:methylenetetrahydrofolate reductase-domain-containing protein [Gigaspora rosea]|uniref:methylenetetrahydrofolate reductase (NADH) n=1 Tax=Gigaspora rosea TaxID=44941 RepID=A0A397V807_9GLOM|nr:methylenetetrahydrofolate reductase-domain-containing protein [Gigaspora rosea]
MKIIDKINAHKSTDPFFSFEFFPPKTDDGLSNLYVRLKRMSVLDPLFVSFTWGAGGSTAERTTEMCTTAQGLFGLETCMHLTCTNVVDEILEEALNEAKNSGIQNILALRGDPPRGQDSWTPSDGNFVRAIDLVKCIRKKYNDWFCIGVAGYPEGHPDSDDKAQDLRYLKEKVDAGADFIITQLFYDVDSFVEWEKECRKIGITVPIIPGIMPIQGYNSFRRVTNLCKINIPTDILNALEQIKHDDQAVKDYGVSLAISMITILHEKHNVKGFHFCTLNLEKSVRLILEKMGFVPTEEERNLRRSIKRRPIPAAKPIIWKEQSEDYLGRSDDWDNFPNGRWGNSKSPAFGELDVYGMSLRISKDQALEYWGEPKTLDDIIQIFKSYILCEIPVFPWSEDPISKETDVIRSNLIKLNEFGYLTVSSQPAVNGVKSDDKDFGWGPKGGYIYQKFFVEFFVNQEKFDKLIQIIDENCWITYYAAKRSHAFKTNIKEETSTAVTWGVFPGKEIVQPTIIEEVSFKAWKEVAFELCSEWERLYPKDSTTQKLLKEIGDNWWLVNLVYNDYVNPEGVWEIFFGIE